MTDAGPPVFHRLVSRLSEAGVSFTHTHHRPAYTSAEAAEVRGAPLHSGAKALIVKSDAGFVMAVLPADLSLDGKALRKYLGSKGLRFATPEEVMELTTLTPGSIPPFGSLFGLRTVCDDRLQENEFINFNAGSHTDSLQLRTADFLAFERPVLAAIARPGAG